MRELADHPATKRIAIASIAIVLFAGIVAAANKSDDGAVGEGRLSTRGRAAITAVDGQRREVTGVVGLHTGETVEAVQGAMTVELPDGSVVEGRPSYKTSDPTRVKIERPVELLAGDLLVEAKDGTDVMAAGSRVHLDGGQGQSAMRVSRSLAVGTSVYHGSAALDSAGQERMVPALRTLEVSSVGRVPATATPLRIDEGDSWDRRFLAEAIDLSHTLDEYSRTYTQTLGTANRGSVAYYRSLLPSLADDPAFSSDLLASGPTQSGETVVGGAIAGLGRRGTLAQRWQAVFAFRSAGAAWGLVALDQGVASAPLLAEVQTALNATPFAFALGTTRTAGVSPTTGGTSTTTTSPPKTTPPTQPPPTQPPPTTPVPVPVPVPVPTIPPPTVPPAVNNLVDNVNRLLGTSHPAPPGG